MNRPQAAVLLGVKESASAAEIRKAYLTRSRLLHPDRFSGSPAKDIQAATAAMAQINAAHEILTNEDFNKATDPVALIVQCGTCGQRNRVSTPGRAVCSICRQDLRPKQQARGAEHADAGFPRWGHGESSCGICGWGPARSVKFNSVSGWIIFWRWFTFEADCCRRCGIALYNENQRSLLLKGWWGFISPLATVVAFVGNLARVGAVKALDEPMGRYPYAITPLQIPLVFSTPWWKRPASLAATATALTAITVIICAALSAPAKTAYVPAPASTSGPITGLVGSCWADTADMTVSQVGCDDPSASWIAYAEEPRQADQTTLCSVGPGRDALTIDEWDLCIAAR
jgi:hypothetical protein